MRNVRGRSAPRCLLLPAALGLLAGLVGCSQATKPNIAASVDATRLVIDRAPQALRGGGEAEFYPLQLGNRWRYAGASSRRENGVLVKDARWTREALLARYDAIAGRTYVREERIIRDGSQEFRTLTWLRQDRSGLYELGPPLIPRDSMTYPVPYETRRLAYPLHRGATWAIDEARRVTGEVERMELLDTPAGRFRAWKVRVRNAGHLPSEEAFVWYSREGCLGRDVVVRHSKRYPSGDTVLIEEHEAEWVQAIDPAPEEPGRFELLGTATVTSRGTLVGPDHRVRPTFGYDIGNAATEKLLFNSVWIDSSSVGSTLVATARSDADFSAVAGNLTNGIADHVCAGACEQITCGAACAEEGRLFGLATPDFKGTTIGKVCLRIDSLSFGRDDRGGQVVRYRFTIEVYGVRARHPA